MLPGVYPRALLLLCTVLAASGARRPPLPGAGHASPPPSPPLRPPRPAGRLPALPRPTCVEFVYSPACPHCLAVAPLLDALAAKYSPMLHVVRTDTAEAGWSRLDAAYDARAYVGTRGVPTVFVANRTFVGQDSILRSLENAILSSPGAPCVSPRPSRTAAAAADDDEMSTRHLFFVGVAALAAALHPSSLRTSLELLRGLHSPAAPRRAQALATSLAFALATAASQLALLAAVECASRLAALDRPLVLALCSASALASAALFLRARTALLRSSDHDDDDDDDDGAKRERLLAVPVLPRAWDAGLRRRLARAATPAEAAQAAVVAAGLETVRVFGPFAVNCALAVSKGATVALLAVHSALYAAPGVAVAVAVAAGAVSVGAAEAACDRNAPRVAMCVAAVTLVMCGLVATDTLV
eukprot:m51a1_g9802 hypothetical protein (414) ;mRNA; f:1804961-1806509